ncbi:MAG: hypothetical protein ACYSW6_09065 [Planctomycetota bacterium]|jgi:hypothetical protein
MKNHTIAEIRERRPGFFKNAEGPERYRVRQNHLIVQRLDTSKINVWQLIRDEGVYRLRPVWHVPEGMDLPTVIYRVETLLNDGSWPVSVDNFVDAETGKGYPRGDER